MSVIKEEDLLKLYSELEKLRVDKEKLQAGFIDLKLKSNKIEKQYKRNKLVLVFLIIALFISFSILIFQNFL